MEIKTTAGPPSKEEPRGSGIALQQLPTPATDAAAGQDSINAPDLRVLAMLGSEDDLRRAIRAYVEELNVPRLELDRVGGLARAHASKLLSLPPTKHFGSISFWSLAGAAGLKLILAVDPASRFPQKMSKRRRPPNGRAG